MIEKTFFEHFLVQARAVKTGLLAQRYITDQGVFVGSGQDAVGTVPQMR
jgi:hypothetical protein